MGDNTANTVVYACNAYENGKSSNDNEKKNKSIKYIKVGKEKKKKE